MNEFIRAALSARWISGAAVFLVAWVVGSTAAEGMNLTQWLGAVAAMVGAITWAVIEQVWPAPTRQPADD
ncbi:hypothetical protein GVN21_06190 [Caulobacter sp. SLTY]|uniref:hypothetical protein n=1 Tax=Caulobacter sp. SLTY TaxID=2683262 RepID=UPI0014134AA3|nr:hypothetical protein [Caulobacter sp. SLTY]NBB14952.1 hypothetical protein [Caulobacter sp. SLTY]